jgi:glutathione-regulated potassium-efflux system ancillary protein KefF
VPRPISLIYAHPYPDRSRAGRVLLDAVRDLPGLDLRTIYSLYPDFSIDVEAERRSIEEADVIVWQCPLYWYGLPALLHLWIEKVLAHGYAYGSGADAVRGKTALWVATTGAPVSEYRPGAMHGHPFEDFVPPISQTARFCGMRWTPPFVVHGSHRIGDDELRAAGAVYREVLSSLADDDAKEESDG